MADSSPGFRQIRQVRLEYDGEVTPMLPKTLSTLDVIAVPDPHGKLNIPYLIYVYRGGPEERKTLRLVSGQAELDHTHESFMYMGIIPPKNSSHPNFATLWLVTKKKSHPDNQPDPVPATPKKKEAPRLSDEAQKAREIKEEQDSFDKKLAEV